MKRAILAAAVLLMALPHAARAQHGLYRFEFTPTASYRFGGTLDGRETELFDADLDVEDSEAWGVTFDIPLGSAIQLELLASHQSSRLQFDDGFFSGDLEFADIDVAYYHVGILWQWGNGQIQPFFVASAGVANLDPDIPGASSESRFSASLGGGVKIFFSRNVGMRLEGRGFWSDLGSNDDRDHDHHDCGYYDDSCYGNEFAQGQASVGLILAW